MGGQGRSDRCLQFQPEFDTQLMPVAITPEYFVPSNIDEALFPAGALPGRHVLNLLGRFPNQPPVGDGQHLWFSDPFGKLSPGTSVRIVGRVGTSGKKLAVGTATPVDFLDLTVAGTSLIITYSAFTSTWNVMDASVSSSGGITPDAEVPKVADLTPLPRASYANGAQVRVTSLLVPFNLDNTSTAPVDGITVAATSDGIGRWLRVPQAVPEWTALPDWEVDPVFGDDEAQGPVPKLKTTAEWCRRMRALSNIDYGIFLYSDVPSTDSFQPNGWTQAQHNGSVFVFGPELPIAGPTTGLPVTNATDTDPSDPTTILGGEQATLQSGIAFPWGTYIGKRVVSSGGSRATVLADLGLGVARVTDWDNGAPPNTDTFDIVDMVKFGPALSVFGGQGVLQFDTVVFPAVFGQQNRVSGERIFFTYDRFERPFNFGDGQFPRIDSQFTVWKGTPAVFVHGGTHFFGACGLIGVGLQNVADSSLIITGLCIQGKGYYQGNSAMLNCLDGAIGVFDAPGDAVELDSLSTVTQLFGGSTAPFYGKGSLGLGLNVHDGARLASSGLPPNVIGAAGEINVDFGPMAMPALEAFAGGPLPALSNLTTYAQLAAAPFNGNVENYGKTTAIITN